MSREERIEIGGMMRTFAQLGHVHRCEPCKEYPGEWIVYCHGEQTGTFTSADAAIASARIQSEDAEHTSVCWACSDDDPRVGQAWFTGFYQLGYFDRFGRWIS